MQSTSDAIKSAAAVRGRTAIEAGFAYPQLIETYSSKRHARLEGGMVIRLMTMATVLMLLACLMIGATLALA